MIIDEGAYVHYVEGCTAPIYKSDSLHSAVVEIIVKKNARCRYTTIQNWSKDQAGRKARRDDAAVDWKPGSGSPAQTSNRLLMMRLRDGCSASAG
jgi:Fe-S cluster assembly protein SufB